MYIKFLNSNLPIECSVTPSENIVTLKFKDKVVVNTSGFHCYLDKECEYDIGGSSYEDFTTIYRDDEETAKYNGYQLSNDGSVWAKEVPEITFVAGTGGTLDGETKQKALSYEDLVIPTPVSEENYKFVEWNPAIPVEGEIDENKTYNALFEYVETLEEVKERKIAEMNEAQQMTIQGGIEVTLTDGTVEHFTLTDHDQTSLMGLQTRVIAGDESIPWHTSDTTEHCKYYSNADMAIITNAALGWVAYHVTYFRDLRIYINSLETKEEVAEVFYGTSIPEEYQSEPLRDMIVAPIYA